MYVVFAWAPIEIDKVIVETCGLHHIESSSCICIHVVCSMQCLAQNNKKDHVMPPNKPAAYLDHMQTVLC